MDYCDRCRRYLNGALACPGCGTPTAGPVPGAHGAERYYRATPFPQAPPPHVLAPDSPPAPVEAEPQPEPDPRPAAADAPQERSPAGYRAAARAARRGHGRRARPRHRVLGLVLATCLGTVLLGVTVSELGAPALPWSDAATSPDDARTAGTPSDDAESPGPADATPAADTGSTAGPSDRPAATASPTVSHTTRPPTSPATTTAPVPSRPPTDRPTPTSAPPTPPRTHRPHPPGDREPDCWLIFCS